MRCFYGYNVDRCDVGWDEQSECAAANGDFGAEDGDGECRKH